MHKFKNIWHSKWEWDMQTDYLFHGIKGFERFAYYCYSYDMTSKEALRRYKIILFCEKYGLDATLEAFEISNRTLYSWPWTTQKIRKSPIKKTSSHSILNSPHPKKHQWHFHHFKFCQLIIKRVKKYPFECLFELVVDLFEIIVKCNPKMYQNAEVKCTTL